MHDDTTRRPPAPLWAWDTAAAVLIALAFAQALRTVSGLHGVPDADNLRDIAQAQTALDGAPLSDPFYSGEWVWYNPLVPWMIAAGSALFRIAPMVFHIHGGPILNLLGPIALYAYVAIAFGRSAAFAALAAFLFFTTGDEPSWASATYSPWLFSANFAQGLFYLGLIAIEVARRSGARAAFAAAGIVTGLTFLAHTAPAILLGLTLVLGWPNRRQFLAFVAAAVIVSLPFLYAIGWHYHFHVINAAPLNWKYAPVTLYGLPASIRLRLPVVIVALAGAFFSRRSRVTVAWISAALALTLYSAARDSLWPALPGIVPTFHFFFYSVTAVAVLFGVALSKLGRIAPVLVVLLAAWNWSAYVARQDLVLARSLASSRDPDYDRAAAFLRKTTRPGDVVLTTRGGAMAIVAPAARKLVAITPEFANPYVAYEDRAADRDAMLESLAGGDMDTFRALARKRGVTRVVQVGEPECRVIPFAKFTFGRVCVAIVD